jgi:hypothetical protein
MSQDPEIAAIRDELIGARTSASSYDNKPVQLHGTAHIPQGMEDHSDWKNLPVQESAAIDSALYGEEYVRVEKQRNELGELKKTISALTIPVAAVEKNKLAAAAADDENKREKLLENNEREQKRREEVLLQLEKHKSVFGEASEWGQIIAKILTDCRAAASAEQFVSFNDYCKTQTQRIFRDQKKLLEELKKIKKNKQ